MIKVELGNTFAGFFIILNFVKRFCSGKELWRFRAVPSSRTVLGNRRVISVWPIRGGPILADGTLYFAAGVWPSEYKDWYKIGYHTSQYMTKDDSIFELKNPPLKV